MNAPAQPAQPPLTSTLGPRLLVVTAHADDAELNSGGLISRFGREGGRALVCVLTLPHIRDVREQEARQASKVLGCEVKLFGIIDGELGSHITRAINLVEHSVNTFKPTAILTHFHGDTHQDHTAANRIAMAACRRVPTVLEFQPTYPSGRSHQLFHPNVHVDLTTLDMQNKLGALSCHASQSAKYGDDLWLESVRSIAAANSWHYSGKHGYAEVFSASRLAL